MAKVTTKTSGWMALCLLAVMLPFEFDQPLLAIGPLAVTNVELVLGIVLGGAAVLWWLERPPLGGQGHWWWVLIVFVGVLLLSAVLAPSHTANALKATFRVGSGILLALAVPILLTNNRQRAWLLVALLTGGIIAAGIGLAELLSGREWQWLAPLRSGTTVTGQFMRLTSPFDYANQASMYFEALIPLLVVALIRSWQKKAWLAAGGISLLILLFLQASFLTLSRSGFTTIAIVGVVMALLIPANRRHLAKPWLGLTLLVVVFALFNTAVSDVFRLRFASTGENDWYLAQWQVPETLTFTSGEVQPVEITVQNNGALTWDENHTQPIRLGGRWILQPDEQQVSEPRWPFAQPLFPGETAVLTIPLKAPTIEGEYTLIWDVVQEEVTWFGSKSGIYATSQVIVHPPTAVQTATPIETTTEAWRYSLPIPPRRTLWWLAWQQLQGRPLLGIGLDNFRLTYGAMLNATEWNETIHTNNWYLEFLVGGGMIGGTLFFAWLLRLGIDGLYRLRSPSTTADHLWQMGFLASLLAYVVHGLLDFFLLFNATGLLFWLLVGLYWHSQKERHAYWN